MAMQAVIMAGGAGMRLRPMTCDCPKPLVPLCGAPVMDYALRLLARHGYDHATATLCYRPQDIKSAFGEGRHGVTLRYSEEKMPLGTAGSVLHALEGDADTVLVLSGDGLMGCDLSDALRFHQRVGAAATLVLKSVDIPLAYGVVVTDERGRILRFIEKPDWSRVVSSQVNTGVYLLEREALALIPRDRPFDFGRELFPLMLQKGMPLYGYPTRAYWCDVGDPAALLRAQGDLLSGRAGIEPADCGARPQGAEISPDSYVAGGAIIAPGAQLRGACVLSGARVGPEAVLEGAILCPGASVGQGAQLLPGSILGAGAQAGDFSRLNAGAALWPGVELPDYAVCAERVMQSQAAINVADSRAHCASPAQTAWLAGAFAGALPAREVAVMYQGMDNAAYHLLLGALAAYGVQRVWALGRGSLGMLSYAAQSLRADGAILAGQEEICLLNGSGLPLSDRQSAAVEQAAQRQELPPSQSDPGAVRAHHAVRGAYLAALARRFHALRGKRVALICKDRFLRALARDALRLAGHEVSSDAEITFSLTESQARVLPRERMLTEEEQWLLCARALSLHGGAVYDTQDYGLPELLPCDGGADCRLQRRILGDGVARLLLLMTLFDRETVEQAVAALPALTRRTADIPCDMRDKGRVLSALRERGTLREQGGILSQDARGRTVIRPDAALPLIHVAACARDAENAQELCDLFSADIKRLLQNSFEG